MSRLHPKGDQGCAKQSTDNKIRKFLAVPLRSPGDVTYKIFTQFKSLSPFLNHDYLDQITTIPVALSTIRDHVKLSTPSLFPSSSTCVSSVELPSLCGNAPSPK